MFTLITMFIAIVLAIVIKKGLRRCKCFKKAFNSFFMSLILAHDAIGSRSGSVMCLAGI